MKPMSVRSQMTLMVLAIVCALLLVLGHLILAKSFAHMAWTEWTAAVIPFVLAAICYFSIRFASRAE
ncbi:hypothetical protein [Vibrio sonorensis]|uniref:hypothetical protein n=1 Tax=Vibrio sonorensis TaxID=1004316 RepID=UPI0008DACC7D|nr:hypothetical protein [Vibrio sonorensis]